MRRSNLWVSSALGLLSGPGECFVFFAFILCGYAAVVNSFFALFLMFHVAISLLDLFQLRCVWTPRAAD